MPPMIWNDDKLLHLLTARLLFNQRFRDYLNRQGYSADDIHSHEDRELVMLILFRQQVDIGPKNPSTFRWIINHIRDGKGNATPRDLIALIDKARQYQVEEWTINQVQPTEDFLIGASVLKRAWTTVSTDKLNAQLYAEFPHLKSAIQKYTNGKSEFNADSLETLLGDGWKDTIEQLVSIGFIEKLVSTWKIPFIYREGLGITQGKAFEVDSDA